MFTALNASEPAFRHPPQPHRRHSEVAEVPAEVSQSLNYQILRRTLMPDSETPDAEAAAREIDSASQAPSSKTATPAPAAASVSAAARAASSQVVEQRQLQVTLGAQPAPQKSDPLVLDLASNGFATRGLQAAVSFDLNADGQSERISAPSGDDALLALDRNGNGRIDDGKELFGDQHGASNGFAELASYDDNQDGRIDAEDALFQHLSLLRFDAQGRQHSQSLAAAGVSAIELQAQNVKQALGAYDEIAQLGRFEFSDGRSGQAADLLLASR